MVLDPKLLEILACPEDKGPLLYFADDIPIMLIDEAVTVDDDEHARLLAKAQTEGIKATFDPAAPAAE